MPRVDARYGHTRLKPPCERPSPWPRLARAAIWLILETAKRIYTRLTWKPESLLGKSKLNRIARQELPERRSYIVTACTFLWPQTRNSTVATPTTPAAHFAETSSQSM